MQSLLSVNPRDRTKTESDFGCLTPLGVSPNLAGKSDAGRSEISNFGPNKPNTPRLKSSTKPLEAQARFA